MQRVRDIDTSFDKIAESFNLPIVEASVHLGICVQSLKKICKEHGISRWPYRKVQAGKSIEEIKLEALSQVGRKVKKDGVPDFPSYSSAKRLIVKLNGKNVDFGTGSHDKQEQMQQHHSDSLPAHTFPLFSPFPNHPRGYPYPYPCPLPNSKRVPMEQRKNLRSFLDEFKLGFPSHGLSKELHHWWGSRAHDSSSVDLKKEFSEKDLLKEFSASEIGSRKRALLVETGQLGMATDVARGYKKGKLTQKEENVLGFVFGEFFPTEWKSSP